MALHTASLGAEKERGGAFATDVSREMASLTFSALPNPPSEVIVEKVRSVGGVSTTDEALHTLAALQDCW